MYFEWFTKNFNVRNQVTSEIKRKEVGVMYTKLEIYVYLQIMFSKEITISIFNKITCGKQD